MPFIMLGLCVFGIFLQSGSFIGIFHGLNIKVFRIFMFEQYLELGVEPESAGEDKAGDED